MDSNHRPPGYEPDELPTALPRVVLFGYYRWIRGYCQELRGLKEPFFAFFSIFFCVFLRFIAFLHGLLHYFSSEIREVYFTRHSIIAIKTTATENQRKLLDVENPAKKS